MAKRMNSKYAGKRGICGNGDDEPEDPEVALNRRENQHYEQGKADARAYQENKKMFGNEMAEQMEMEAEMFRYNNGLDDY